MRIGGQEFQADEGDEGAGEHEDYEAEGNPHPCRPTVHLADEPIGNGQPLLSLRASINGIGQLTTLPHELPHDGCSELLRLVSPALGVC